MKAARDKYRVSGARRGGGRVDRPGRHIRGSLEICVHEFKVRPAHLGVPSVTFSDTGVVAEEVERGVRNYEARVGTSVSV